MTSFNRSSATSLYATHHRLCRSIAKVPVSIAQARHPFMQPHLVSVVPYCPTGVSIAQARHPFMQRRGRRPRVRPLEGFNRSSATSLYATWQASCQRTNRRQGFNRSSATSLYATWENHEPIESYHICFNRSSATSLYATIG